MRESFVARDNVKRKILLLVARHDGDWYWYQIDRALSDPNSDCIGPFFDEIKELVAEGLIEIRASSGCEQAERYWLTDAGKLAVEQNAQLSNQSRGLR
jgi:hypothetical protein